jgi:hypothetical protein
LRRAAERVVDWEGELEFEGADEDIEWRDLRFWLEDSDGRWIAELESW